MKHMTGWEAYIMGYVVSYVESKLPEFDGDLMGKWFERGGTRPLVEFANIMVKASNAKALTKDDDNFIGKLVTQVTYTDTGDAPVPIELTGCWQLGYLHCRAGAEPNFSVPEDIKYIKAARDALGMTQRELGEALGISQVMISKWERDLVHPNTKTIDAINALLEEKGLKI